MKGALRHILPAGSLCHVAVAMCCALVLCGACVALPQQAIAEQNVAHNHVDTPTFCLKADEVSLTAEQVQASINDNTVLGTLVRTSGFMARYRDASTDESTWKRYEGAVHGDIGALVGRDLTLSPTTVTVVFYVDDPAEPTGVSYLQIPVHITTSLTVEAQSEPEAASSTPAAPTTAVPSGSNNAAADGAPSADTPAAIDAPENGATPTSNESTPATPAQTPDRSGDSAASTGASPGYSPWNLDNLNAAEVAALVASGGISMAIIAAFLPTLIASFAALRWLQLIIAKQRREKQEDQADGGHV